jgi:hypothetical protein
MRQTLWKNNLNFVKHVPIKQVNLIVITVSEEKNRMNYYRTDLRLRPLCGTAGYPPNVLQPFETYCTNPALVSPFHLPRRSTPTGVRDLYQRKVELWARNV